MTVLVLACDEKCEKSFGLFSNNHKGKEGTKKAFFFFSKFIMPMYEYDFNFLDVFLFQDLRSQGVIRRTGAAKVF